MNYYLYKLKQMAYTLSGKKEQLMKLNLKYYYSRGVKFGKNMRAFSPLISAEPYLLEFGDNITVSGGVKFITHDNSAIKVISDATDVFGKIKIENDCFIGYGSIILPGITIGENTIVAAGSVVTKSFSDGNVVIGGNPAKIICDIDTYKNKIKNNSLNTNGLNYISKKEYLLKNESKFIKK